jgi:arginyl-tRNA synthetase
MNYLLTTTRADIAKSAATALGVDIEGVVVENATNKVSAELAIPVFRFVRTLGSTPTELAERLTKTIEHPAIEKIEAMSGFVNIWLKPDFLAKELRASVKDWSAYGNNTSMAKQEVLIEHTDPNPFKLLHIGHVYSNTVGESLARLHEASGASVTRLTYHGDAGLHIAKAVWAIGTQLNWKEKKIDETIASNPQDVEKYLKAPLDSFYAVGHEAYEGNEDKQAEIEEVNRKIYSQEDPLINRIYEWGKKWSFEHFKEVFAELNVHVDRAFYETESGPRGMAVVKDHVGTVFTESDGAIVYESDLKELHTRVFINSQGLPTYEAKDLGLAILKDEAYPKTKRSVILTGNEVDAYFKVVLAALHEIQPKLAEKTIHMSHGMVRLPEGKMSSRTGNILAATTLLERVREAVTKRSPDSPAITENTLAAIKYAFLKPAVGADLVFNLDDSVSLEGQTGPYIQYAAVRMGSILEKTTAGSDWGEYDWQEEREMLFLISLYPEIVAEATAELTPHRIAQFIYDLAKEFNRYYEHTPVKDAPDEVRSARIFMLKSAKAVLEHGLHLLNIPAPKKM